MRLAVAVALLGAVAVASPARAQYVPPPPPGQAPAPPAAAPITDAAPAIPANGIDPAPRRGFYVEAGFGLFTTVGGSAGLSNAQPILSMLIGHHLGDSAAIFLDLGIGSSSSSCYDNVNLCTEGKSADSFEAAYLELGASYGWELVPRLRFNLKVMVGGSQFAPSPLATLNADGSTSVSDSMFGPHFGGGVALDYDTHLDHFGLGIDITGRYTIADAKVFSLAVMPRIRYVF